MRIIVRRSGLLLVAGLLLGCSGSEQSEVTSPVSPSATVGLAAGLPALGPSAKQASAQPQLEFSAAVEQTAEFQPPFPDKIDLFSPPKVVVAEVTPEPEPELEPLDEPQEERAPPPLPPLRLLGFADVEGSRALLEVEGQLNVVAMGDEVRGVEILAVEKPDLTLQHADQQFTMNLFAQPWRAGGVAPGARFGPASLSGRRHAQPRPMLPAPRNAVPRLPTLPAASDESDFTLPVLPDVSATRDPDRALPSLPELPGDDPDGDDGELPPLPGN